MSGIGKAVIAVFILMVLVFALVTAISMAAHDKSTDSFYKSDNFTTANGTIEMSGQVAGYSASLLGPLLLVSAIMMLATFLFFLRKSS